MHFPQVVRSYGQEYKEDLLSNRAAIIARQPTPSINPRQSKPEQYVNQPNGLQVMNINQYLSSLPKYPNGLHNLGNTCYMNSALQVIMRLIPMIPHNNNIARQYNQISQQLNSGVDKQVLAEFKKLISQQFSQFKSDDQQDASEFFHTLLQYFDELFDRSQMPPLNQDIQSYLQLLKGKSPIKDTFGIHTLVRLTCGGCKNQTSKINTSFYLNFELSKQVDQQFNLQIEDEIIDVGCDKCKHKKAIQSEQIVSYPQYLLINLKRYKKLGLIDRFMQDNKYKKDMKPINIPDKIQNMYYLKGFIDHQGTESSGHYVSYCFSDQWYHYNDLQIQVCPLYLIYKMLQYNSSAYLLVYQKY